MSTSSGYRESNSTADRALSILAMYSDEQPVLTAAQIADELGVARSTAYRYLQTLISNRFIHDTSGRGFELGSRVLELARIARRGRGLSDLAIPVMRQVADRTHNTILLTRLVGDSIVCVEREEWAGQRLRLSYERGSVLDLNAGAPALVTLAWLTEDRVRSLLTNRPLHQFTSRTIIEPEQILVRLAEIRSDGYAISRGELDQEVVGVTVPVFEEGTVEAALSVVVLATTLEEPTVPGLIDELQSASKQLTHGLELIRG